MSKLQNNFEINRVAQKISMQLGQQEEGFPWISAYLDTGGGKAEGERLRHLLNQTKAQLRQSAWFREHFALVKAAWKCLTTEIRKAGTQGMSLLFYRCPSGTYLSSVFLPISPRKNFIEVGRKPRVDPLEVLMDQTRASLCLLLEPEQVSIYSLFLNQAPRGWKVLPKEIKERNDFWVLLRYQRPARGGDSYFRHLALITDHLLKQYSHEKVIVYGGEESCEGLVRFIPSRFRSLIETRPINFGGNLGGIVDRIAEDGGGGGSSLEEVKRKLNDGRLMAVGVREVIKALRGGNVRELVVSESVSVVGWECVKCGNIDSGQGGVCGCCQSPITQVENLRQVVMGRVRRDGGKIVELKGGLPEMEEGMVAFLRYPLSDSRQELVYA